MTEETKIEGNTRTQQETSSLQRDENKLSWARNVLNGVALALLVLVGINLTGMEIGLFWQLIVALVLYQAGSRIGNISGKKDTSHSLVMGWWPAALKVAGAAVALVALLSSGIGMWTASVVDKIDTTASCAANPNQLECVARDIAAAERAAAERAARERARMARQRSQPASVPTVPPGAPTRVVTPACGQGWAKVDIPPGWYVQLGWNDAAATNEWRSVKTGQWEKTSKGGADAVRFCAKHLPYAGDTMALSWRPL